MTAHLRLAHLVKIPYLVSSEPPQLMVKFNHLPHLTYTEEAKQEIFDRDPLLPYFSLLLFLFLISRISEI